MISSSVIRFGKDLWVTLVLWGYFTVGFILLFSPMYLLTFLFSSDRESGFQKLNHYFCKGFFGVLKKLVAGLSVTIPDEVLRLRFAVIICNHQSYLDPILLISLFPRHKTIVKANFFRVPIFGWFLRNSGYLPSASGDHLALYSLNCLENMRSFLEGGGNLFVFPEGTRSRDGHVGLFRKGAFSIARRCRSKIAVFYLENTGLLFKPGKFLFHTENPAPISIRSVGTIRPDYTEAEFSLNGLMNQVRSMLP